MANIPNIPNLDQVTSFGKENVEALVKSSTVATQAIQDLAKTYTTLATQNFERVSSAISTLTAAKTPAEFQTAYNALVKQNFEGFVADSRKVQEQVTSLVTASFAPLAQRFQSAASTVKSNS